ncbi:MAG TPA: hypothetical protein VGO80_08665 [Solirubrobacteraceae bacterium]|jgi:hypothetical protein|nr:hypothetical protein [Solirubrobacteraceae bacterium]
MPTSRPRHTITESDAIALALRDAARRWPDDRGSPRALLEHLVIEGHRVLTHEQDIDAEDRRAAIRRTSGALTGTYPAGYLSDLRDDWPQ